MQAPGASAVRDPSWLAARHADIYDQLAEEYDARTEHLAEVTEQSVSRLLSLAPSGGRALDAGAGAGLVAETLVRAGFDTTAIDVSPNMAEVCRRRCPQAHVVVGDYLREHFDEPFDVMVAFAFIHLFPTAMAVECLQKMRDDLTDGGLLLIGTTAEPECGEGFEAKDDYPGAPRRYRRRWSEPAFLHAVRGAGFEVVDAARHDDPYGKRWLDLIVKRDLLGPPHPSLSSGTSTRRP